MKRLEKNAPFSNLAGGIIRVSFEGQLFFSSVVVNCQLVLPDTALKGRRIGTSIYLHIYYLFLHISAY